MVLPELKYKCCQNCKKKSYLLNKILGLHFFNNTYDVPTNYMLKSYYESLIDQMLDCKQCSKHSEFYAYLLDDAIRFEPSYAACLEDKTFAVFKKSDLLGYSYLLTSPVHQQISIELNGHSHLLAGSINYDYQTLKIPMCN